ncbi:hypothetical protein BaRGS_00033972 [Batillaria attramentaria]|uniref:Uncharacterized protein n=1 Tax=Batillaria attramentaria TaxID=370345 RepID=A0ABD0JIQ9_9CAEN
MNHVRVRRSWHGMDTTPHRFSSCMPIGQWNRALEIPGMKKRISCFCRLMSRNQTDRINALLLLLVVLFSRNSSICLGLSGRLSLQVSRAQDPATAVLKEPLPE